MLFSIPLVQLSGFAFPIRNMPAPVQWLTEVLPATHYIRVSRAIYLRGAGPVELWRELLFLGVFGVAADRAGASARSSGGPEHGTAAALRVERAGGGLPRGHA